MNLFKAYSEQAIEEDRKRQEYWIEQVAFTEPGFEEQLRDYIDKLKRSVANLKSLAVLPLIENDIIYDYKISSLSPQDQVFSADKPGDPSVTRIRSAILGKVSDSDIMFAQDAEKHLSDYLASHKGWDIYWFVCQYGAASQPDKETMDMLDESKVKLISGSGVLKGRKREDSGEGSGGAQGGADAEWVLDDAAYQAIRKTNAENVKATENKGTAPIMVGGRVVFIGNHPDGPSNYIGDQADLEMGAIKVKKAGAFSKKGQLR